MRQADASFGLSQYVEVFGPIGLCDSRSQSYEEEGVDDDEVKMRAVPFRALC